MNMLDLIYKKKEGKALTRDEFKYFIQGYTKGDIADYQAAALLMAIYFQGLSKEETFLLTEQMYRSGDSIDLSFIKGIKVDKHSTGGVGDKTTLIVGPLAASCGVPIAKMSGRGLGFTGGTIDKLESIPGFKTTLTGEEFMKNVNEIGISLIGQTGDIAPADKKLYALRDVTGTVDNIGLISGSIMSKKLASGSDAIVLDVKCGNGAFMPDIESAILLSEYMTEIGYNAGKETIAIVTDMNQPLGRCVGNALEVEEAIEVLKGEGPEDITHLCLVIAAYMVLLGEKANSYEEALEKVKEKLYDGSGLEKFKELIDAQGGDVRVAEDFSHFKSSPSTDVFSQKEGYVTELMAHEIGMASLTTGAGRETKESEINLAAGIYLAKKIGDKVDKGDLLAKVYCDKKEKTDEAIKIIKNAYKIEKTRKDPPKLIKAIVTHDNVKIF